MRQAGPILKREPSPEATNSVHNAACLRARAERVATLPIPSCLLVIIERHVVGIHIGRICVLVLHCMGMHCMVKSQAHQLWDALGAHAGVGGDDKPLYTMLGTLAGVRKRRNASTQLNSLTTLPQRLASPPTCGLLSTGSVRSATAYVRPSRRSTSARQSRSGRGGASARRRQGTCGMA